MSTFKEVLPEDIKTARSFLTQLIDVLQEDISGSTSRRKYQHFVTGGVGPGVTSSLFQTVYDQDLTLQTSNALFDLTLGIRPNSTITSGSKTGEDAAGKELFPSSSMMMREKLDVYRQFAQTLLGDANETFKAPFDSNDSSNDIDAALFLSFKRLFHRDGIKRETFAMRFFPTASTTAGRPNLDLPPAGNPSIFADIGSSNNKLTAFGGQVGNLVDSSNTATNVGLVFYDRGVVVLDLEKVTSASQFMTGTISGMTSIGTLTLGATGTETAGKSKFVPDFIVSASIDNIVDHVGFSRFGSGSSAAITFQNMTNINSSLVYCRAAADEFNYSSNPTFTDDENRIVVIDVGQEDTQTSFTMITGVGLYDASDNLLAVAKLSRPVEKNNERDLTLRVRLDY